MVRHKEGEAGKKNERMKGRRRVGREGEKAREGGRNASRQRLMGNYGRR